MAPAGAENPRGGLWGVCPVLKTVVMHRLIPEQRQQGDTGLSPTWGPTSGFLRYTCSALATSQALGRELSSSQVILRGRGPRAGSGGSRLTPRPPAPARCPLSCPPWPVMYGGLGGDRRTPALSPAPLVQGPARRSGRDAWTEPHALLCGPGPEASSPWHLSESPLHLKKGELGVMQHLSDEKEQPGP